jgi:hypothetical protein
MGIGRDLAEAIIHEHTFRPLTGDVVTIGRQTVYLTPRKATDLVADHGIAIDPDIRVDIDKSTLNKNSTAQLISDVGFLRLLGVQQAKAMDHSDYEGAEIIHNLSTPIPDRLVECADVIIDGSTLDNVFDPVRVLTNYAQMLRPGGRLIAMNAWSPHPSAYVLASANWFLDYFVENEWADCKVYVVTFVGQEMNAFYYDPKTPMDTSKGFSNNFTRYEDMATIVIAERGSASTCDRYPTQQQYRQPEDWDRYRRNLAAFSMVPRPHIVRSRSPLVLDDVPKGFLYVDRFYEALDPSTEMRREQDFEQRVTREADKRTKEMNALVEEASRVVRETEDEYERKLQRASEMEDEYKRKLQQAYTPRGFLFHHSRSWLIRLKGTIVGVPD